MTGNDAIWIMFKRYGICDAGDISIKGTNVRCYLVSCHPDYQVVGTAYMANNLTMAFNGEGRIMLDGQRCYDISFSVRHQCIKTSSNSSICEAI